MYSLTFSSTGLSMEASPTAFNTEEYEFREDSRFRKAAAAPLSTFSIDVDAASYANVRRMLDDGTLPPADAVRSEELINYFPYGYPQPVDGHPVSITTDVMSCPWNSAHRLVLIGLQGRNVTPSQAPPNNLVFLIDVSGSMEDDSKLPLLVRSLRLLVDQLRPQDRVAIAVYAGASGLLLPPTPGDRKDRILGVLDRLQAGGCTAGAEGLALAYATAHEHFRKDGNNRVILATDGDFNVGVSSTSELVRMVEKERESGIYLSVLGFGEGNLKDSRMEQIADKGNGNYYYIDGYREARKVFVSQLTGTLLAIAKDVKVQVEFNPALVAEYRLIGYENRLLNDEDFADDRKDAGELGAGHSVTALYEIVPAGAGSHGGRPLRYQRTTVADSARSSDELLTVRLRYKRPDAKESVELSVALRDRNAAVGGEAIRFASAVAEFAMLLRNSEFKGSASWESALQRARGALGDDIEGWRNEFVGLLRTATELAESPAYDGN
jgi:Ca-activated chloride channel family protein